MKRTRIGSTLHVASSLVAAALGSSASGQVLTFHDEGTTGSSFGLAVDQIGDVDHNGIEDFAVGAPGDTTGSTKGVVVFYSGATGAVLDQIRGGANADRFGAAIDGPIDSDGDGWADVLIGDPYDSTSANEGGRVIIYSPHLQQILVDLQDSNAGARFGHSLRALHGDLDGDGIGDFVVGAPGIDTAWVRSGATGASILELTANSHIDFGWAVCRAGDLDGDGRPDFLVGSPLHHNSPMHYTGRVAAFSGKDGTRLWFFDGTVDGASFGLAIGVIGDVDGDGRNEVLAGAPDDLDPSGAGTGSVRVISGASGTLLYTVYGDQDFDGFGYAVHALGGDMDGDGSPDFVVGAPGGLPLFLVAGYARTFSGISGAPIHTYVLDPPDAYSYDYGISVTGIDQNGDGRRDVLIGADRFHYNKGAPNGCAELFVTAVAGWQNYGAGWPGTLGVPPLTASNAPVVGQPIDVDVGNSAGVTTAGFLVVGVDSASIPTSKGGTLLVDPLLWIPLTIPSSGLVLSDTIANDPALYGVHGYFQVLEADAGASNKLSFTQGLDLFFGFP